MNKPRDLGDAIRALADDTTSDKYIERVNELAARAEEWLKTKDDALLGGQLTAAVDQFTVVRGLDDFKQMTAQRFQALREENIRLRTELEALRAERAEDRAFIAHLRRFIQFPE